MTAEFPCDGWYFSKDQELSRINGARIDKITQNSLHDAHLKPKITQAISRTFISLLRKVINLLSVIDKN